jgi:phosphoserine phosphatase RsbU/P
MARRDIRTPEQKIKMLEQELAEKERELLSFRGELNKINAQLEKFISQLAHELKLAALIQRSLVPTEIPTIPGFEFSTKFVASSLTGGDYFDIFELEDKMRFGILLANSSGHGMASLFLSVLLKLTTNIEAKKGMEPNDVLIRMTKEIQANLKADDLANVIYMVIDRRRYDLAFSRAGGGFAYLYKYPEDKLVRLDSAESAIGKDTKAQFKVETLHLDPRDKLILLSEGIGKAQNPAGEQFGEDRVIHHVMKNIHSTPHELRNEILYQVTHFADGREYPQDLSVLVMGVKDKVIKLRKG